MANVDFNLETLRHYQNDPDEYVASLANSIPDDFRAYSDIVNGFDEQIKAWRKTKSGAEYRAAYANLDSKRRMVHDNCINSIHALDRLAKKEGIAPFMTSDAPDPDRTALGQAIIQLGYETVQMHKQNLDRELGKNSYQYKRDTVNDYNFMLGYTKYPLVHDKKGNYAFINMFTEKPVDYKQVKNYVKGRTQDADDLAKLTKANELVQNSREIDLPKLDISNVHSKKQDQLEK